MDNTLSSKIQHRFGRKLLYSSECEELSIHIYEATGVKISAQTLRRIIGFIKDNVKQSIRTLNTLSIYCGYRDFADLTNSKKIANKNINTAPIQIIKSFYEIENLDLNDFNYHSAAGNVAKIILRDENLVNDLQCYLSKNEVSQIYFFERFPNIDGIAKSYKKLIRLYLQEKKEISSQLFGYCLLHLGAVLSLDKKESKSLIKKINAIGISRDMHSFLKGRFMMANLLQSYIDKDLSEVERLTKFSFEIERMERRGKEPGVIFPYYQYILADAFNLIEDYASSNKMISISELDYNRIAEGKVASGYYEALDLIKAINLAFMGKSEDSKRILNRIRPTDIIFIQQKYFLIQRYLAELLSCNAKSKMRLLKKIDSLIAQTEFKFFRDRISIADS